MAREHPVLVAPFPTTSTGLVRYQFGSISTSGQVIAGTSNNQPFGVVQDGTTGSTRQPRAVSLMLYGISKLKLDTATTVGVGQLVAASTIGAVGLAAEDIAAGLIVEGTSGGANRIVSILLSGPAASTASV